MQPGENMARLTLKLLGGFEARVDGGPPLVLPAKVKALLAFLALYGGQGQPREKISDEGVKVIPVRSAPET